jgi:lipopolysaccharide biosynthesis protein
MLRQDSPKLIALYLPQFHPIIENDEWWGKGFTEWTNVTRAQPLFRGHYQPHLPADLGFYDLRLPEARIAQAELAGEYGIFGFCYYHYWFNGRRLLERPFDEVLMSGEPSFPFCLCWANENWTRAWDGLDAEVLISQKYSDQDDLNHIRALLPAFADPRYIRVDGKPLFLVYRANRLPNPKATTDRWRQEAERTGLGELFLCRVESFGERRDPRSMGFDAAVDFQPRGDLVGPSLHRTRPFYWARRLGLAETAYFQNNVFDYPDFIERMIAEESPPYPRYPCVVPSWDNSSRRRGRPANIFIGSTPDTYKRSLVAAVRKAPAIDGENPLVFVNAWNEWAEGSHLEPCQKWGRAYLEATREALMSSSLEPIRVVDSSA